MRVHKPETIEDFEMLRPNDVVVVQWSDNWVRHNDGATKIMAYNIHSVKTSKGYTEVICRLKGNHYFNYDRYLQGLSNAEQVYIIASDKYIDEVAKQEFDV